MYADIPEPLTISECVNSKKEDFLFPDNPFSMHLHCGENFWQGLKKNIQQSKG